jgi:hypothetical protein
MFGNSQMGGMNLGFPDVCMTPIGPTPVPIPYPNFSLGPVGVPPSPNVLWMCTPAHTLMTKPVFSLGDNPGIATGIASATVMAPTHHVTGAFTVLTNGIPSTRMTSVNIQNNTNCPGMTIVPAQVKVLLLAP